MKKIYFLLLTLSFFNITNAQIVNIPDANFKAALLAENPFYNTAEDSSGRRIKVDANNDGLIQVNEAQNISRLNLGSSNISSLQGISNFSKLTYLHCAYNKITSLDVSSLVYLTDLLCQQNELTSLNVTGLVNLTRLNCQINKLTSLNVKPLVNIKYLDCGTNQLLTTLDLKGLVNLEYFNCYNNRLTSLDLTGLVNLKYLDCRINQFSSLDLKGLVNLEYLMCDDNKLTSLDLTGLVNITDLSYKYNQIISLDLTGLVNLTDLSCIGNQISSLDLNYQKELSKLDCRNNKLRSLLIKNTKLIKDIYFDGNPNLEYICVNESQMNDIKYALKRDGINNCEVNTYCSFTPGGTFYILEGNSKLDLNQNGCDNSDEKFPNLNFSITNGIIRGNIISNAAGNYSIPVGAGTHTITPNLENPNYFTVSPSSVNVTFPTQTSPFVQNFCITPKGVYKDLEVTIFPVDAARPGFDATYKIIYKNKANQIQSGSVVLSFNDAVLDYVSAIPATNNQITDKLTWDFSNLKPFESREITVTLNVNSPMETPAVNNDDRLSFNALITPVAGDEKPVDNSSALRQTVVGSYDPNDKTCLEGDVITPDLIGEYVHYLIRFENTGTYPAENVVIKDLIDLTKFDISTLTPTKASHDYVTKISDGNKVEFIFEKINLPFDDANNDGYIAFKIKTLPTLVVNDTFTNEANIYFDYNFPILTNKAISTFKTLGSSDFEFADYFSLYPNPVNNIINIETKSTIEVQSMAVYDVLGQIIIAVPDASKVSKIDVSKLASGNYFLKMNTNKGTSNGKFIK